MLPTQITVRSISDSPAIEYHIHKHLKKINRIFKKIKSCRVVIDTVQRHKHKGKLFSVSIDITIPGKELVCRKNDENLFVAIRDAFAAIEKLLRKYTKRKPMSRGRNSINYMANAVNHPPTAMSMY